MSEEKTSSLLRALKLDEDPFNNNLMFIEELNCADGSFIISSIIKHEVQKNKFIILILCHNSLGHFQAIGQKLGYNLIGLKEAGQIFIIDIMEKVASGFFLNEEPLKDVYNEVERQVNLWGDKEICITIENCGNLILANLKDLPIFIHYLRVLAIEKVNCSLVCSSHNFKDCAKFTRFTNKMKHVSDIVVTVTDLSTGKAKDVTGFLNVTRLEKNFVKVTSKYQYHLDKTISVFTPGSNAFFTK